MGLADHALGLQIIVLNASAGRRDQCGLHIILGERPDALFVGTDPFFTTGVSSSSTSRSSTRFPRHILGVFLQRLGRLMGSGSDVLDGYRQVGAYVAASSKGRSL